jgi:succinate dehydrogenase/fumarate reductase flavoprotein subunit
VTKEIRASEPLGASEVARWDREADVVVVGLGIAGGAAAIEAARAGSEVLVLERASEGGGASAESEGMIYFGGGTPIQRACGFEDSTEEMFKYLCATSDERDEEKIRLYCEQSLEHYQWFIDLGLEFKESFHKEKTTCPATDDCLSYSGNEMAHPFSAKARPAPRGHKPRLEGNAGGYVMQKVIQGVRDAGVEIVTDARVETLVRDGEGAVVGAVADLDGERRCVWARRGVILACGGFAKNREMLARHAPELLRCNYPVGTDGDDGSGIRMGVGAGGSAINMSQGFVSTPFYPPGDHVKGILVNEQGQRFINEDAYHGRSGDAILRKQEGKAYLIVDHELYGQTLAFHKNAAVEESIEELEKALGMPEDSLSHTVRFFNRHAERGEDPLFHKHPDYLRPLTAPPFAALDCRMEKAIFGMFTLGGLETLATGEVRRDSGEVIPGLYAAGRTTAGIPRTGWGYTSGTSLGDASFFGRLAGRSAAAAPPRAKSGA